MSCPRCKNEAPATARRAAEVAGTVVPGAALVLMPKCPVCVAGYVAVATGLGISVTAASYLRWGVIACCVGWLAFVANRLVSRLAR